MSIQKCNRMTPARFAALAAMTLGGLVATASQAASVTIAQYNFDDGTHGGTTTDAVSDGNDADAVAGLTASAIAPSTTSSFFSYNDSVTDVRATNGSDDGLTWYTSASLVSQGVNTDKYLSFTITPDAGYSLTLGTLTAKLGVSKNTGAPSGDNAWSFVVYTSLDGYSTQLGSLQSSTANISGVGQGGGPIWTTPTLDLSGLGEIAEAVTIRLYFSKDSATVAPLKRMIVDTLSLTGETTQSIPEPAAAFTGLALAGAAMARRHRPDRA